MRARVEKVDVLDWNKSLDASVYDAAITLVQTGRSNYEGFTKKDIKAAKVARKIQGMIGSLSEKDYGGMVSSNMIKKLSN